MTAPVTMSPAAGLPGSGERARGPGDIIDGARAAGLLTDDDIVWHDVEVTDIGHSHNVYRISIDGVAKAVVKVFGPPRGDTDGDPAREHAVRALAAERPDVAALLAPAADWLDDPRTIASLHVGGVPASQFDPAGSGGYDARGAVTAIGEALAPALARFHRATRDLAAAGEGAHPWRTQPPWGLRLLDGDSPRELWGNPPLAGLIARWASGVGADPVRHRRALEALREARERWRPMCLIHGDLKHDNVLVEADEHGITGVTVIDWEMARLGDPAWDLAGLAVRLPLMTPEADGWAGADLDAVAAVVGAYAAASGLGAPALARRVTLYTGVWQLMVAVQSRSTRPFESDETPTDRVAARARDTLADADILTEAILARMPRTAAS